ncbi:MAG TPA: hypothetical protein PKD90_03670 [Phnomibacter sp.]|nr:hypothetical protein [Phnomibacter sp.]
MVWLYHGTSPKRLAPEAQAIVAEGKLLYQLEMAAWLGTDLFLEKSKETNQIGGYFSYLAAEERRCIFFSKDKQPAVMGTLVFDESFNTQTARIDLKQRAFTKEEQSIFEIRQQALEVMNEDTIFKIYENTNLNLIPLIHNQERKVYVLTGPTKQGVVILGNDYLIQFNERNEVFTKKPLHKNIIPMKVGEKGPDGQIVIGSMHSHLPETGDFITPTDICTLMLYAKYAGWQTHRVVTPRYINNWNCVTNELTLTPISK